MLKYITILLLFNGHFLLGQHSLYKLDYPINNEFLDEICPVLSFDEKKLFFTRTADPLCEKSLVIDSVDVYYTLNNDDYLETLKHVYKQLASNEITDPLASDYNQDIWYTHLDNQVEVGLYHPGFPINDVLPNSLCTPFRNGNQYIVLNQFEPHGGIELGFSFTIENNGQFTFPKPLKIDQFKAKSTKVNVSSAEEGKFLIIAMENSSDSTKMDLYLSQKINEDHYSAPQKLDSIINSIADETTPHLSQNEKMLFFSSNRAGGLGGMDIYYAKRLDDSYKNWSKPIRLDPPVNSINNDSYPYLMADENILYFTSDRDGSSDIFKAKLKRTPIDKPLIVHINIISESTMKPIPGEVFWSETYPNQDQNSSEIGYFRSKNGKFDLRIKSNRTISIHAINRQFSSDTTILDPQLLLDADSTEITINLVVKSGKPELTIYQLKSTLIKSIPTKYESVAIDTIENLLHNIYFEQSRAVVLPKSYIAIDKLAEIMLKFPRLYVSINGHTDNVGDTQALVRLSQERAEAIKNVLMSKGIPNHRVNAIGFGPNKPVAPNDSEPNKSKNRRVEIKVLSM